MSKGKQQPAGQQSTLIYTGSLPCIHTGSLRPRCLLGLALRGDHSLEMAAATK
jgi:hypothetical protein